MTGIRPARPGDTIIVVTRDGTRRVSARPLRRVSPGHYAAPSSAVEVAVAIALAVGLGLLVLAAGDCVADTYLRATHTPDELAAAAAVLEEGR